MKVLFVSDTYEYYGAAESFMSMIQSLSALYDIEPVILTTKKGRLTQFAEKNGFKSVAIKYRAALISAGTTKIRQIVKKVLLPYYLCRYYVCNILAIKEAEKEIDFSSIDLIHSNVNRTDIGYILAKKHGIKHIWHIREFSKEDYECIFLNKKIIQLMNDKQNQLVAVSNIVKEKWIEKGVEQDRIKVIYNGLDVQKYKFIEREIDPKRKKRLVMAGVLAPSKGIELLIKAVSLLPEDVKNQIIIDVYGDGPAEYKRKLLRRISSLELSEVIRLRGYANDLNNLLREYDIGLMCSRMEAFGRITVEYMLSGVIVIASDSGANSEIITDGKNGFLYKPLSAESLSATITHVTNQLESLGSIRDEANRDAQVRFSQARTSEEIKKVYEKLLFK